MPKEAQYAVSVGLTKHGRTVHSPTMYLHPSSEQPIANEAHAKELVEDWFRYAGQGYDKVDVAVAATTVHSPNPQAESLLHRVKQNKVVRVYVDPFGLPEGYLLVHELGDDPTGAPAFECGIALDGSVSS